MLLLVRSLELKRKKNTLGPRTWDTQLCGMPPALHRAVSQEKFQHHVMQALTDRLLMHPEGLTLQR